ncbi:hypothetical protein PRK78_004934 [Emydomyces testavorans]|uniref:HNH nuclease domain-containing protein n=1 Tax=Emydomyces testavorans TaxID=2070801 RepID=A0AAF0DIS9_9EURO|nr:hypothetical protein PRK78_004934 [Emydomyces testavorans]
MPIRPRPRIPSNLVKDLYRDKQSELAEIEQRKERISCEVSHATSVTEFIEKKVDEVDACLEYIQHYNDALKQSIRAENINKKRAHEELDELRGARLDLGQEALVLKRQRKIIAEDLEDELPRHETISQAYLTTIVDKTMSACAKQKKVRFRQTEFKKCVTSYLAASKIEGGDEYIWCHVQGDWQPAKTTKTAHIVPKSLTSDELSYFFGVGEVILSDRRNGITLDAGIEEGLDSGKIVIVPAAQGDKTRWKCVLIDQDSRNRTFGSHKNWGLADRAIKHIDGKELEFRSDGRPAARYLYFRYAMTCLYHIQRKHEDWLQKIESVGAIWATPGPYLRQSMLKLLAQNIGDIYLPEVFYKNTTFVDSSDRPAVSQAEEELLAKSLEFRAEYELAICGGRKADEEENELDEEDEG